MDFDEHKKGTVGLLFADCTIRLSAHLRMLSRTRMLLFLTRKCEVRNWTMVRAEALDEGGSSTAILRTLHDNKRCSAYSFAGPNGLHNRILCKHSVIWCRAFKLLKVDHIQVTKILTAQTSLGSDGTVILFFRAVLNGCFFLPASCSTWEAQRSTTELVLRKNSHRNLARPSKYALPEIIF